MGRFRKRMGKMVLAWSLTLAMVLTGISLPDNTGKAQAGEVALTADKASVANASLTKNAYGTDYIYDIEFGIPDIIGTKSALESNGVTSVEVTLTMTGVSGAEPDAMLYTQPVKKKENSNEEEWGWCQSEAKTAKANQQITLSYNFSKMDWDYNMTMGKLAVRFAVGSDGTKISYRVDSAKLITSGSSTGGSTGGNGNSTGETATEEQLQDLDISLNPLTVGNDWSEYNFIINNKSSEALTRFIIKVPVLSGNVNAQKSFGGLGSITYSDSAIYIYFTKTVPANSVYKCPNDAKFGFGGGGATLGKPVALVDDGSYTPSNKLNYEITGQPKANVAFEDTPVGKHGKLQLKQVDGYPAPIIVDEQGNPYQLRGASTHGMQWFPEYVNEDAFRVLRDEWGVNMVRLVSYVTQNNGYTNGGQTLLDSTIEKGVEAATKLGLYVIVDWHIHEENPNTTKGTAREFFKKYAAKYKNYNNVIFEVCNEPTNTPWYNGTDQDIYNYADEMCGIIRNTGSDAIIVCGTNDWSQKVDEVKGHTINYDNIMYTFHFYAGTHGDDLRNRVKSVSEDGIPIFVTEFGVCAADGNGGYDTANADKWIALCDQYNISFACWSFCNKGESASYLLPECTKTTGGWLADDLTETGFWLINTYRAHQDKEDGTTTSKPVSSSKPGSSSTPGGNTGNEGGNQGGSTGNEGGNQGGTGNNPGSSTDPGSSSTPGDTTGGNGTQSGTGTSTGGNVNPGDNGQSGNGQGSDGQSTAVDQRILSQKTDKDIKGSVYAKLALRAAKTTKNSVTLKWKKLSGANSYIIYGNRCGNANRLQKLATVSGSSWTHKNLTKGTYYKYVVVACKGDSIVSIAKTIHVTTAGGKKANAKKIKLKKAKVKLKKGKKFKIKAKMVAAPKKAKIAKHRKVSYESANRKVATVSSGGVIKAKKKGSCVIYAYAQNGVSKKIKVKVK